MEKVKIGKGYMQSGYGKGFKKNATIYLIDGKCYARDKHNHRCDFNPLKGELEGYVRVNKLMDWFHQCSDVTIHDKHLDYIPPTVIENKVLEGTSGEHTVIGHKALENSFKEPVAIGFEALPENKIPAHLKYVKLGTLSTHSQKNTVKPETLPKRDWSLINSVNAPEYFAVKSGSDLIYIGKNEADANLINAAPLLLDEHVTDVVLIRDFIESYKSGKTKAVVYFLENLLISKEIAITKATK